MNKTHPLYKYRKRWFNNKSLKVLDLFAGTQSVRKALEEMNINFEYKGIDIYSPEEENIILDLSQPKILSRLKDVLGDWMPDFIWASPLCTTFSIATAAPGGTVSYIVDKEHSSLSIRRDFSNITHVSFQKLKTCEEAREKQWEKAQLGLDLMNNAKLICAYCNSHFGTQYAIEQPQSACSKWMLTAFKKSITHYCAYGFTYKKATAIYSNKEFDLKKCSCVGKHQTAVGSSKGNDDTIQGNKIRSRVPSKLIQDVITQSMEGKHVKGNSRIRIQE